MSRPDVYLNLIIRYQVLVSGCNVTVQVHTRTRGHIEGFVCMLLAVDKVDELNTILFCVFFVLLWCRRVVLSHRCVVIYFHRRQHRGEMSRYAMAFLAEKDRPQVMWKSSKVS